MKIATPEKLNAILANLKDRQVDAVLVSDFETGRNKNLRYLSGQPSDAHLLLFADGSTTLIVWDMIVAKQLSEVDRLVDVSDFDRSYRAALVHSLKEKLGEKFVLEVLPTEGHFLVLQLQEAFPQAKIVCQPDGAADQFIKARAVKTAAEIETLREGAKVTNQIIASIKDFIKSKPGLKELDLALYLETEMKRLGAEGPSFETLVANRERSGMIHQVPSASEAQLDLPGLALTDFGLMWKGYATDVTVDFRAAERRAAPYSGRQPRSIRPGHQHAETGHPGSPGRRSGNRTHQIERAEHALRIGARHRSGSS